MVVWFWVSFAVTVALLGVSVWAGLRRFRRLHFVAAPLAIASLTGTILLTEQLVRAIDFPPFEMSVHLWFAKTAAALVVPVVISGILTVKRPRVRRWHRYCVALFLLTVVVATCTGVWMFSISTPK